jgi:hypothetical protein
MTAIILGIISLIAILFGFATLSDIGHGEDDLALEWNVVRVMWLAGVPVHTHAAQWGVALAGRVDLTIDGVEHTYTTGDHYFIPAGVEHSARIHAGYAAMEFYDEPARWSVRKT